MTIQDDIAEMKLDKGAVILAHNYQRPEIQDMADFVGDSLELSIKASRAEEDLIVFCGVSFMAETAKILCPDKKVLIPRPDARCPMADMVTLQDLIQAKEEHPSAKVVSYVNTNAEIKAESDICCTSANAVAVVESVDSDEVIFVPDTNLANYVSGSTEKTIIPWNGYCHVHARMSATEALQAKQLHPNAILLVHPECTPELIGIADRVLSTGGMIRCARQSGPQDYLVATEEGILYRLRRENPTCRFMPAGTPRVCPNMKKITIGDLHNALAAGRYEVNLEESLRLRASRAINRMLALSQVPSQHAGVGEGDFSASQTHIQKELGPYAHGLRNGIRRKGRVWRQ